MTNVDGSNVKVYFRSSSKYAKIAHFPEEVSTDQLYLYASKAISLPIDGVHLFLHGILLPPSQTVSLQMGAIIHVVRLDELRRENISVFVKKIHGDTRSYPFSVNADLTVGKFIDDRLSQVYGQGNNDIFLVHMGRQLDTDLSFRKQQVEDGSELLCIEFQQQQKKNQPAQELPKQQESRHNENEVYTVRVPIAAISQLQTPQAPKDIYPTPNFPITVPAGIETSNSLNLIFDSKVRRSSSIGNIGLDPSEVIPEQDSFADLTKRNQSYQSEPADEQRNPSQSRLSENWQRRDSQESDEHGEDKEEKEEDLKAGDMIYAGDKHMMCENNVMGALINGFKEKMGHSRQKSTK